MAIARRLNGHFDARSCQRVIDKAGEFLRIGPRTLRRPAMTICIIGSDDLPERGRRNMNDPAHMRIVSYMGRATCTGGDLERLCQMLRLCTQIDIANWSMKWSRESSISHYKLNTGSSRKAVAITAKPMPTFAVRS